MKKNIPIIAVAVLAGLLIVWALTNQRGSSGNTPTGNTVVAYEEISLGHNGRGLVPTSTTLKAGKSYKIAITPDQNGIGCMSTIKLPGVEEMPKPIIQGQTIAFNLNNPQPGTYTFICNGMGMQQGDIVVEA